MKTKIILFVLCFCWVIGSFAQQKWTLLECIEHAKENSIEVLRQKQQNLKFDADQTMSKGNYFPDVSFNASQGYRLGNSFDISTGVGQLNSRFNSFSLSSNMDLFKGFQNRYKAQQAKINNEKGRVDIDKIGFEISLTIASKYLEILMNKEIEQLAIEQIEISEKEVNRLKKLFDVALKSKTEYLEMKATHDLDQKELIAAKNRVINGLLELQNLIDVKPLESFDIASIEIANRDEAIYLPMVDSIVNKALNISPILKSTRLNVEYSEKAIRIAKSNFLPSVSLNYNFGSSYYHIQGSDDVRFNSATNMFVDNGFLIQLENNLTHYVGITARIPIFNKLNTKSNLEKAKVDLTLAELELDNQKKEIKNKIEIAYNDVITTKAAIVASTSAATAQEEAFSINQRKYKNGFISNYEFLESKGKFIQTKSELIRAKYEYLFKVKLLELYQ